MNQLSFPIKYALYASLAASACVAVSSQATTTVVDGSCISVADGDGCLFDGNINSSATGNNSFGDAQDAYNLYNNTNASANPDIALTILASSDDPNFSNFGSLTGSGGSSGTWSLPGYLVDFYAVKASNQFVLYQLNSPASSGAWDTFDIPFRNNPHDVSHLVFFGQAAGAVPEPATWAMMLLGFGFVGGAMRSAKRRQKLTVSYA